MPTFVEEVQSVGDDPGELRRRLAGRVEAVGDAVGVLEEWTESSRETHAELSSKYDTAKSLARDEIREATGGDGENAAESVSPENVPAEDLVSHPAVSDRTKRLLSEYSTKLYVFLDEERSYEGARGELLDALGAELALYERLSGELGDATSVRDAQEAIARFARAETPGPANRTAADVLLESGDEGGALDEGG